MEIQRLSAFANGDEGGNPAGVALLDELPRSDVMQRVAADVGFSETAFAVQKGSSWRVRYFSPESEVPFCGHATIALGAVLAQRYGNGRFTLELNDTSITVDGEVDGNQILASLQSPETSSAPADPQLTSSALELFGWSMDQIDNNLPPAFANAGANHLILGVKTRQILADMEYDLSRGRAFMSDADIVTICLVYVKSPVLFHTRNPFASGGVYEDPATGAATAALAGYLRDINWPHNGKIEVVQGEDMGYKSLISAEFGSNVGESIRVSGAVRVL